MKESKVFDKLIAEFHRVREELRALSRREDELRDQKNSLRDRLLAAMDAAGTDLARSSIGTVSINEKEYPQVEDWDAFWTEIHRKKAYYLMERRPSAAAFREFVTAFGRTPRGVISFKKRDVSLRSRT